MHNSARHGSLMKRQRQRSTAKKPDLTFGCRNTTAVTTPLMQSTWPGRCVKEKCKPRACKNILQTCLTYTFHCSMMCTFQFTSHTHFTHCACMRMHLVLHRQLSMRSQHPSLFPCVCSCCSMASSWWRTRTGPWQMHGGGSVLGRAANARPARA